MMNLRSWEWLPFNENKVVPICGQEDNTTTEK